MGTGLNANDPTIVSAFHAELFHQGLVVLVILALVALSWNVLRALQLRRAVQGAAPIARAVASPEPVARRVLRISFGLLWIFDGILQGQQSMPLGMAPQVIRPAAASSPAWVQHLLNSAATLWSYHPVAAPAAAVWIQIGIGVMLLVAPRGRWSQVAGAAGIAWGLLVWVLGEAFGQIFAPGLTWLFGAPGAVLFYCVAGVLVALPERMWATPRLGRTVLRAMGVFFLGMALLQAWPGRGFWQGRGSHGAVTGTLTGMVQQMASTPQPHLFSSLVSDFASFDTAHGWAVNLFAVVALAAVGAMFLSPRIEVVRVGVVAGVVLCLADWVFVEDLGFMGGVGTDPNSMIPMALVFVAGYLAVTRLPAGEEGEEKVAVASEAAVFGPHRWMEKVSMDPTYVLRIAAAIAALGIVLVGAAPFAVAATDPHADPILSQAIDGTPNATNLPAPVFDLVDQSARPVSIHSLRGKVVALTFLDPVCTSDCPIIAQEFRAADAILGASARHVELVAVDANPRYTSPEYLRAFDAQEGLDRTANWLYLTGSLPQLESVWDAYGAEISYAPGGAMIAHSESAFVIDAYGRTRYVLDTDPGPGTEATESSFSVVLADSLTRVMNER